MNYALRITHYASVRGSRWLVSLSLFLLALIPRLFDLGRFLTADEFLWVDRSRNFLAGLTNPAFQCTTVVEKWEFAEGLACTLRTGHPGVTTMWTGSFGLWLRWLMDGRPASLHDYVVAVETNPLDATFVAPERLATVVLTSLWVVAVYWLIRRLVGDKVALIAALLLALDPFHIALSRVIHHDALSTTFMTLSVLTMLIYWGQKPSRWWLLLSGVCAGFAFLSKSPSLFLMPFVALVGLWYTAKDVRGKSKKDNRNFFEKNPSLSPSQGEGSVSSPSLWERVIFLLPTFYSLLRTFSDGLLWFFTAVATVFIFWPAMWVIPLETIETVIFIGSKYATGGHAKGNFFLGTISNDPGPLFYPATWLFRATPLVVVGVIAAAATWLVPRWRKRIDITGNAIFNYLPLILLFIAGYTLMMTIGEKKQDRYFLPVYPWLTLIAAVGLVGLTKFVISRLSPLVSYPTHSALRITHYTLRYPLTILIALILIINGSLVVIHFPYYFTYYNPLLGGPASAAKSITIGWGEGLDLVADYLNQHSDPRQTRVSSWYQSTFAPYYQGQAISYSKEKGKALAGDYVTFYINQTQRRFPDDVMFDYFESRFKPETTIALQGIDYAWIYPSLGVDHYVEDQTYTGIASLLAWQWQNGDAPLTPGRPANFELYWEYLGKKPEEQFFFRLVDQQGRAWTEGRSRLVDAENPPQKQWREGEILLERGAITPPLDMPPGQYQLQIGFYTDAPAVTAGKLLFDLPPDEALITVDHSAQPDFEIPASSNAIAQPLDDSLMLLGAAWPIDSVAAGESIALDLHWRAEQQLPATAELHLGLMDENGEAKQAWFNLTLGETFNPAETTWQPGDIIRTRWQLDLLPEIPPGQYHLELVLPEDTETSLPFADFMIK